MRFFKGKVIKERPKEVYLVIWKTNQVIEAAFYEGDRAAVFASYIQAAWSTHSADVPVYIKKIEVSQTLKEIVDGF